MNLKSFKSYFTKEKFSWAFYDWANSAFATTVMAGFFPIFLKKYWSPDNISESTYLLGIANSISSFLLAVSAPLLGAISDRSQNKKVFLGIFCLIGAMSTGGLAFIPGGSALAAIALFSIGTLGFAGGNIFYDALLTSVSEPKDYDFVSGLGYSLGYLGGGVLFLVNVLMTLHPHWFFLSSPQEAIQISFVSVAIWWVLFSFPLFLNVKEKNSPARDTAPKNPFAELWQTLRQISHNKFLFFFLLAYLFYIDGVNTIVKMAVDYGLSLGFDTNNLITALLITQFVGFPSAIIFGILGEKWGAMKGIVFALVCYAVITIFGYTMNQVSEFYYLAIGIGLVQGGIQALSRSHFAKMIPQHREAEYFGLFNMVGKFSAVLGPLLVGAVSLYTQNARLSILVILVLFIAGGGFLFLSNKASKKLNHIPKI